MQVQCTKCGLVMDAPAQYAGMMMACSRCRAQFQVPAAAAGYPQPGYGGYGAPPPGYGAGYGQPGYPPQQPAGYGGYPGYAPPAGYGAPPSPPRAGGNPAVIEAEPASANKVAPTPQVEHPEEMMPTPSGRLATRSGRHRMIAPAQPASARGMATFLIIGVVVLLGGVVAAVLILRGKGSFGGTDPDSRKLAEAFLAAASVGDADRIWEMMSSQSRRDFNLAAPEILKADRAVISGTGDDGHVATAYGLRLEEIKNFDGKILLKKLLKKNPPWNSIGNAKIETVGNEPGEKVSRQRVILKIGDGEKKSFQLRNEDGKWTVHLNPDWR